MSMFRSIRCVAYVPLLVLPTIFGCGQSESKSLSAGEAEPAAEESDRPVVLFLGTSLTAALGLDPEEGYPALVQEKIDSAGLDYRVVNAGSSGETSAGARARVSGWLLKQPFDVLVIETGANDMLRGAELDSVRTNIQAIVDTVRAARPEAAIVLAGMMAPPNLGEAYAAEFRSIYPELAKKNDLPLIPFLLEGVGGQPEMNLQDGIHPNEAGHRRMAETVWMVLEPLLRSKRQQNPV